MIFASIFLILAILGSPIYAQEDAFNDQTNLSIKNFTSLPEALLDVERFIRHLNGSFNFPSVVFGLTVKGKPVIREAYGYADLENWVPADLGTRYRLASISKTFTSVIIGQLVDRGLVAYDDAISKYLPESVFPQKEWEGQKVQITVRQLLSHTAGTHASDLEKDFLSITQVKNVTEMIAQFAKTPLVSKPGTGFLYSNLGFQLLGAIIESVTKKPCQEVMAEFLKQNNLTSSYVGTPSVVLHDIARYYSSAGPNLTLENVPTGPLDSHLFVEGYWPAGGILSTVGDLSHYGQLLIDSYHGRANAILTQKTVREMWSAGPAVARHLPFPFYLQSDYQLGFFSLTQNASANDPAIHHRHLVWHAGGMPGVSTMLVIYPEEEAVGVVLVNKGLGVPMDQIVVYAMETLYGLVK